MTSDISRSLFPQATKRHLTQRIESLDGKLDEQKEISREIKSEVNKNKLFPFVTGNRIGYVEQYMTLIQIINFLIFLCTFYKL